jgi:HK97 family phage prohead protease
MKRAHAVLEIKTMDAARRTFEGIATTITADRGGDIVEPKGAVFKLPLPLLYQHDALQPIGNITEAVPKKDRIEVFGYVDEVAAPPTLKERLDVAWTEIQRGLVRGLSIGFNPIDFERIKDSFSYYFKTWEWLELSSVTIPMNAEANIVTIKSLDARMRAALGHSTRNGGVRLINPPGASGQSSATRGAVKLISRV